MSNHQNPTLRTAKKAAELWKSMLRKPTFDNGDKSEAGLFTSMLASLSPSNATDEILNVFGEKLTEKILTKSDKYPEYYPNTTLGSDYGPDLTLDQCANESGLKCQFPFKTVVWVMSDCVQVRNGYGAEAVFHYALDNGKWLVTTLCGSEIEKIKKYVTDGTPLEFKVEGGE